MIWTTKIWLAGYEDCRCVVTSRYRLQSWEYHSLELLSLSKINASKQALWTMKHTWREEIGQVVLQKMPPWRGKACRWGRDLRSGSRARRNVSRKVHWEVASPGQNFLKKMAASTHDEFCRLRSPGMARRSRSDCHLCVHNAGTFYMRFRWRRAWAWYIIDASPYIGSYNPIVIQNRWDLTSFRACIFASSHLP